MANTADVIILSSSPNPTPSPGPIQHDDITASHSVPRSTTPPPIPSSAATTKAQTRSRFFPTPIASDKHPQHAKQPKKRATKQTVPLKIDDPSAHAKPPRKAKRDTNNLEPIALGDCLAKDLKLRENAAKPTRSRPRKTTKTKEPGNMKLAGKVTKNSSDPPPKKSSKGAKKTAGKKLLSPEDDQEKPSPVPSNTLGSGEVLHLDEAMRRRLDWTPPRETACVQNISANEASDQNDDRDPNATVRFGKLLSDYNYSGVASNSPELIKNSHSGAPTKRRRIDLVDPFIQSLLNGKPNSFEQTSLQGQDVTDKSKKTSNSKPKRFTTLTARMTAQYAANDTEDDKPSADLVAQIKTTKSRRSKATETVEESPFTILPPEAAVEYVNDQDLMFGTCSQLEREDSPQTLRETQEAIRASEKVSYPEDIRKPTKTPVASTRQELSIHSVSNLAGTRNLWSVANRDNEGSLVQSKALNVIDLTDGIAPSQRHISPRADQIPDKPLPKNWFEHAFADIDSPPDKKLLPSTMSGNASASAKNIGIKSPQATKPVPGPRSAVAATKSLKEAGRNPTVVSSQPGGLDASSMPPVPQMPQYSGFTDAELSKQVASFGFKAVRGRKKMMELLQQCWESKHGSNAPTNSHQTYQTSHEEISTSEKGLKSNSALDSKSKGKTKPRNAAASRAESLLVRSTSASASGTTPQTSSQDQVREKSINVTSTSFLDIEEIQDSEEELTLSPSRVQEHYDGIYSKSRASTRAPDHSLDILTKTPPSSPAKHKTVSKTLVTTKSSSASVTTSRTTKTSGRICSADLSAQITKAVRAQSQLSLQSPSLGSRSQPTWHEKILMYDPIMLEDFAAWLNTEGLGLVGEDREVGPGSVREWCESKGICCCWKKNASW